ncbi:hypothetical protein L596_026726 [Steinernema carpocapsae]|uniref:Serpentine receptor class gamma n=1 Tax=Steinernema carpocapsae TaxID=34508 RepID=A0A4U5M2C7_STECR|nr:hypothetical protein L596_026726 [Steinernema carpocapsae]
MEPTPYWFQLVVGFVYMAVAVVCMPVYGRIVYLFATQKLYKNVPCYRIIIHTGVLQMMMGSGSFFYGLMQVFNYDFLRLALYTITIMSVGIKMEALLSLVLAVNRASVTLKLHLFSSLFYKASIYIIWIFGTIDFIIFCTPLAAKTAVPGQFQSHHDRSKPYSYLVKDIGSYICMISYICTFVLYTIIVFNIIKLRLKSAHFTSSKTERSVLLYAIIQFAFKVILELVSSFHVVPTTPMGEFAMFMGYALMHLLVSPVLFLMLNRQVHA